MSAPRRIGILGGMGPEATVLLMSRLIAVTPAQDDADHIPLIVDMNTQVPSRIAALIEGSGADPAPVLAAMAKRLEAAGAEALAMPCNTAHHYAPAICAAVTVPFLDMVALSAAQAASRAGPGGRVGILASPAVRLTKLFDAALARHGAEAIYPADQNAMLVAIRDIKRQGRARPAIDTLAGAGRELANEGARVQLVACSEFSIVADTLSGELGAIDTLDILVAAIVRFATGEAETLPGGARTTGTTEQAVL